MSVIGLDFGTSGSVMASVRAGKIQVIRNEISERFTPAIVSYTASGERIAGDVAMNAINSNFRVTCRNMKPMLGRRADPVFIQSQVAYALAPIEEGPGGQVMYNLPTTDAPISVVQATASYLKMLAGTAKTFLNAPQLGGVVISVPSYYSATRIDALAASAEIAGVYLMKCVKEYMAVAMDYGIYRKKQFDERVPTVTAFVSVGHGHSWVTIAEFTQHYGKILCAMHHEGLGGRILDDILIEQMGQKFKKSSGLDALSNPRARLKLESAASKAKKTLSSNKETTYGIECLMEGEDIEGTLLQDDLAELSAPLCNDLYNLCRAALEQLPPGCNVSSVELVGNGSRAPVFIQAIEKAFVLPGQRTLSSDETIARGCALYAALYSPTVRMKEYPVFDWNEFPPRKLTHPPAPKPTNDGGFMKGFLNANTKPTEDASATVATSEAETTPPADGFDEMASGDQPDVSTETGNGEEVIPGSPEPSPAASEVMEEEEEDAEPAPSPIALPPEDPSLVTDPLKPGHIRAYEEQEKAQTKKDVAAQRRRNAINQYEETIFYCRDKTRAAWPNALGDQAAAVIPQIEQFIDAAEEWLWDHMEEDFIVYEDRLEDLKHFVGQWMDDFKPKPPAPAPEPTPEPTHDELPTTENAAPEAPNTEDTETECAAMTD